MGLPSDKAAERVAPAANNATAGSNIPTIGSATSNVQFGPYPAGAFITISVIGDSFHLRTGSGAQTATTSDAELPAGVHDLQMPDVSDARLAIVTHSASIRVSVWRSGK